MICFDTNIIVYLSNGALGESIVSGEAIIYASVVRIEALGYRDIRSIEERRIKELLATFTEAPLTESIIESAVRLRQQRKMSLGDAIIAATALEHNCELWTANTAYFEHIQELKLINPLKRP